MNARVASTLAALAGAGLLGFGYYLQYEKGLEPCPLCLVQRAFFYALTVVFLVTTLHGPRGWGLRVYGFIAMLLAAGGFATASRQVWLQHLPADKVPACGPDLEFMLENFPLGQTLEKLFAGSGQCAEVQWTFLNLSIAEWALAWFAAFFLLGLWLLIHRRTAPVDKLTKAIRS
ncbi:MAG: disulfide bond formation protein B [Burkholderiales bacterium]|nr:disulfide bond formation protein B [Burkholderiales bacterium]